MTFLKMESEAVGSGVRNHEPGETLNHINQKQ